MTWNFRVTKQVVEGEDVYEIREVYYDDDGSTVHSWTIEPAAPRGETLAELTTEVDRFRTALGKPVVDLS